MATTVIELLPKEYGYVLIIAVLYYFLNFWMSMQVGNARKKYKVFYPTMYALESENKEAKKFNCIQRGHQNTLESIALFYVALLVGGIRHPVAAAALGLLYTLARFFYFRGYSSGDPEKRFSALGGLFFPSLLGLFVCVISLAVSILTRAA